MKLSLPEPCYLEIEVGEKITKIDVFAANRVLEEAQKQPGQDQRWRAIAKYLETTLGIPQGSLAENQVVTFNQAVIKKYDEAWEIISKKVAGIASSQQSTKEESPQTIPIGKIG